MEKIEQSAKKTILVVEDEESLRMAMALVFRINGYNVIQSSSGNEAYEIAKKEKLDIIVSDVRMPNGDGVDLLQKVRALHNEKPVLFLVTGYTDLKIEDAYDMGADAVFAKPFNRDVLLKAIKEKLLEPRERWQQATELETDQVFKVHLEIPSLGTTVDGQLVRIGRGGFFVATDQPLPLEGTAISFSIQTVTPPAQKFEGTGIIRWVRHNKQEDLLAGCGVEFHGISPSSIDDIMQAISAKPLKALIPKG